MATPGFCNYKANFVSRGNLVEGQEIDAPRPVAAHMYESTAFVKEKICCSICPLLYITMTRYTWLKVVSSDVCIRPANGMSISSGDVALFE